MQKQFKIGYTTGTFDVPHRGHFSLLQRMSTLCEVVIVGVTIDSVCQTQKRTPILTYEHRSTILQHCRHVDLVVAHSGEPKDVAHSKLKFDVLFIGDDYYESPEYTTFVRTPVLFIPRTVGVSSTDIIIDIRDRLSHVQDM